MLIQHARHGSSADTVSLPSLVFNYIGHTRPAYSGIKFDADGQIYAYLPLGTWSRQATWLQKGAAGAFFLSRTLDKGALFADAHDAIGLITDVTKADPAVVTAADHGMVDGDSVRIENVVGMTELNGNIYEVDSADAPSFELKDTDSSAYTAYASGGVAYVERMAMGTDREYITINEGYGELTVAEITFEIFNAVAVGTPLKSRQYTFQVLLEDIEQPPNQPNWQLP